MTFRAMREVFGTGLDILPTDTGMFGTHPDKVLVCRPKSLISGCTPSKQNTGVHSFFRE